MDDYLDETALKAALTKPNWYQIIGPDFRRLEESTKEAKKLKDDASRHHLRRLKVRIYELIEQAVEKGTIPLATSGQNLDKERQTIDTVVIHHTVNQPGMALSRLNAIQLMRIYGLEYDKPYDQRLKDPKEQLIWSNHFYQDKQVFWGYHWLIREDGMAEQILRDEYVGWHAGNWNVNTRSVGICIDDNLTNKEPSQQAISAIRDVIEHHYSNVKNERILGHHDVNNETECPGKLFQTNWREKLFLA